MEYRHQKAKGRRAGGEPPCTTTRSLALDAPLAERIAREARRAGMTVSAFMRGLMVDGLDRREARQPAQTEQIAQVLRDVVGRVEAELVKSILARFVDSKESASHPGEMPKI